MGEHGETWLQNLHLGFRPSCMHSSPMVHQDRSQGNLISGLSCQNTNMTLKNGSTLPGNDSPCWFYSVPHLQPPIPLASNSVFNGEIRAPNIVSGLEPKKFLVVDQCKDQTRLMFGSGFGTAVQCLTSLSPEFPNSCLNFEEPGREKDSNCKTNAVLSSDLSKEDKLSMESEMHEDTEELNALLYSDDDESDYEDEEVRSTGHSPDNEADEFMLNLEEEVTNSVGQTRKRKMREGEEDGNVQSMVYTSDFSKETASFKYESIAEFKCGSQKVCEFEEVSSFSSNKKSRKEKIRQTVSVLQSIIPGSHGKETMAVLDEAINYLKFLKLKAKTLDKLLD